MAEIGVIGSGSWGTALALVLNKNGHHVTIWSYLKEEADEIRGKRENPSKLPGVHIPEEIEITTDLRGSVEGKDVVVLAVPSMATRATAKKMCPYVKEEQILVNVAKGIEEGTLKTLSEQIEEEIPQENVAVLSEGQKVKEIFVEKGQEVEPGTKLFEYDTEELAMTLEQGNLELEKIGNSISNLNSQIAALTTEKKNAPAGEQLSYTTQIQELQTNVKQEEYNYKVKELEVNRTKKSLESSTVTSTIAGIIQEINPDPGYDDYSGEKQAFMSILSTGKYRIKGKISEQNIGELQPGMDVTVRARNNQEEIWKGSGTGTERKAG